MQREKKFPRLPAFLAVLRHTMNIVRAGFDTPKERALFRGHWKDWITAIGLEIEA